MVPHLLMNFYLKHQVKLFKVLRGNSLIKLRDSESSRCRAGKLCMRSNFLYCFNLNLIVKAYYLQSDHTSLIVMSGIITFSGRAISHFPIHKWSSLD